MADTNHIDTISDAFLAARAERRALPDFPGEVPGSLKTAYAVQDRSIAARGEPVAGWKIGLIPPAWREKAGAERLTGPIFAPLVRGHAPGQIHAMEVFEGGFAAVEAEFVFRLTEDAPVSGDLSDDRLAEIAGALHVGVEIASSPFAGINDRGPMSVVSDFGNNNGLILGPEIEGWREIALEDLPANVRIDGRTVGEATAAALPGGPLGALRFLIDLMAARGIALPAGTLVSTGAATGVHEAPPGAGSVVSFGRHGEIALELVPARAPGRAAS
ncbi:2-keto-4-pentenoate hydratase [Glycocaulis profundi]|nr:2-keto-4-pentenoate hydratase [Glycocaulis profundi]